MFKHKPLTPHLTIYKTENSALYSIWHRITGVSILFILLIISFIFKLFIWGIINFKLILFQFIIVYIKYFIIIFFGFFVYHVLNGYRHIFWSTNKFLNICLTQKSSYLLLFLFCIVLLNWILYF